MTPAGGTVTVVVVDGRREVDRRVLRLADGVLVPPGHEPDPDGGPEVVLTLGTDDAAQVGSGALDPSVAYMRGTMKVRGDPGLLLQVLPVLARDPSGAVGPPGR